VRRAQRPRPASSARRSCAALEDACIARAVKKQEEIGLESITDGEFRRDFWHLDFLKQLDGIELVSPSA
jgi:5-methyltetrahydropteroyltriglutamate--homocysteine methyltransferase